MELLNMMKKVPSAQSEVQDETLVRLSDCFKYIRGNLYHSVM